MEGIRPNSKRAKVAIMLLYIVLIFEVFTLVSDYFQYELLSRIVNRGEFTIEEATSNDNRQQAIAIFFIIALIASMITFIRWFRRAYFNLHVRAKTLQYSVDDALWCWFIPILNFFRPYNIMKDMYTASEELHYQRKNFVPSPLNHSLMGFWWAFWVLSRIADQFALRYTLRADGTDEMINSTLFTMISSGIGIVGGLLAIAVVQNYSAMENMFVEQDHEITTSEPESPIESIDPALS